LLSVLGSQGEAGQFRTPRHIIDFMVEITDPKKDETILDPACGTAGFLISSYKHILKHNSTGYQEKEDREAYDEKGVPIEELPIDNPLHYSGDRLTPDDRKRLATNIGGYDISPDMVRLSLVNMYLHGFIDPHIEEYDTLTSDEKWSELADVILANPPFMSPKGGIRPHNRFAVQSKRSEVLFVDYIAEHLTPNGRAAIVVPEGVIFQSQSAYKQLREMLVKGYLVAVISLPAGVFNPYSGVKTSILMLDKRLAKQRDEVLFVKIENDGFNLGAQRRPIDKNDLPEAVRNVKAFLQQGEVAERKNVLAVSRERIGESGEWNLSVDRYVAAEVTLSEHPLVKIGELFNDPKIGGTPPRKNAEYFGGGIPWVSIKDMENQRVITQTKETLSQEGVENSNCKLIKAGSLLMSFKLTVGRTSFAGMDLYTNEAIIAFEKNDNIDLNYLSYMLPAAVNQDTSANVFNAKSLNKAKIKELVVPLPSIEVQKEIVSEIKGYQKIINGARQVVDNYQPRISIHPDWPVVEFSEAPFEIIDGDRGANYPKKEDFSPGGYCVFLSTKNVRPDGFVFDEMDFVTKEKDEQLRKGKLRRGDVVLTTRGTIGNTGHYNEEVPYEHIRINSGMLIFRPDTQRLAGEYLFNFFQSENFKEQVQRIVSGAAQPQLPIRSLNLAKMPLPDIDTQKSIVAEIEAEQNLVNATKELIRRFEEKIKQTISRVWGEAE